MSESHFDEYEHYNYDQDKAMFSGHSGKQRSKKEAEQNTNRYEVMAVANVANCFLPSHPDIQMKMAISFVKNNISSKHRHNPGGHERKIVQKLQNAEAKQKAANGAANGTANSSTADK